MQTVSRLLPCIGVITELNGRLLASLCSPDAAKTCKPFAPLRSRPNEPESRQPDLAIRAALRIDARWKWMASAHEGPQTLPPPGPVPGPFREQRQTPVCSPVAAPPRHALPSAAPSTAARLRNARPAHGARRSNRVGARSHARRVFAASAAGVPSGCSRYFPDNARRG